MDKNKILKTLKETISDDVILSDDYEDKYYLSRRILKIFPDIGEETVYRAIACANQAVKHPRKNEKFFNAFVNSI